MRAFLTFIAFLGLAVCPIFAQNRTGQGSSKDSLLSSPVSKSSSKSNISRGIFDAVASPDSGKTNTSTSSRTPGKSTTASPFGTTASPFGTTSSRTRSSTTRRWKTSCKLADCLRDKAVPSNTNLSLSGTITNIKTDGRYTILTMFDSVETTLENGARGDVPVTLTVVMDAEVAGKASLKENTKKSFVVDSNYVYLVWNESGCSVRAVDNALTEPDPAASTKR